MRASLRGVKNELGRVHDPNDPSMAVTEPHARGQEASLAARKRGGRSEQAQQGWQRLGDLNIDLMGAALTRPTGIGSELQI